MRWVAPLVLVALGACNSLFGNERVAQRDAQFFDAPLDAAVTCPRSGELPQFSTTLHPVIDQPCHSYALSADTGRAYALGISNGVEAIFAGPIDQPLDVVPDLPVSTASIQISAPRISPEGDLLLITLFDLDNVVSTFRSYTRNGDGWVRGPDLPLPMFGNMSVPSRAPDRRVIAYDGNVAKEFAQDATGAWSAVRDVMIGPAPGTHTVWLSPDALRIVAFEQVSSAKHLYYVERASRDDDFSPPRELAGVPVTYDPFITEDCRRIYMASVDAIFYANGI